MASGRLSTNPAPMPRTTKPPPVGAKPQPGGGHSHSQLGGRSMVTLSANAAASVAQTHAHQGGQMNEAQAKIVLKEAVDAVVNSFAKRTHGHWISKAVQPMAALCVDYSLYDRHHWARTPSANGHHARDVCAYEESGGMNK